MKRFTIILLCAAAAIASSCAKTASSKTPDEELEFFNAWVTYNKQIHPEYLWKKTDLGCYVLEETPGTGNVYADSAYVEFEYTTKDLEGNITSTTDEMLLCQTELYTRQVYTGPVIYQRVDSVLYAGLDDAMKGMKKDGYRKVLIPGWLLTTTRYGSIDEYRNNVTGNSCVIYEIKLKDGFNNIYEKQMSDIRAFVKQNYPAADTLTAGIYFQRLKEPSSEKEIPTDSTVYINYVGKLLSGQVFDTNIKRVAQDAYLEDFDNTATYEPTSIKYADSYSDMTMGSSSSSMIEGFARTLKNMHPGEKAVGIFWSGMGYGSSGSSLGDVTYSIPPYAPLVFEIELVAAP